MLSLTKVFAQTSSSAKSTYLKNCPFFIIFAKVLNGK